MNRSLLVLMLCAVLIVSGAAMAWDVSYEGNVLPNDVSLGSAAWIVGSFMAPNAVSTSNGIVRLVDASEDRTAYFLGGGTASASTPVTAEARVRIASSLRTVSWGGPACLTVQNSGAAVHLYMSTNSLSINNLPSKTYAIDMTTFHTIRLAMDAAYGYKLWLDGYELGAGTSNVLGSTGYAFRFGATTRENNSDSYWDYVRYSKSYTPVPEPSSLLAGIGLLTGLVVSRRRVR